MSEVGCGIMQLTSTLHVNGIMCDTCAIEALVYFLLFILKNILEVENMLDTIGCLEYEY